MKLKTLPKDFSILTKPCTAVKDKISKKTISEMKEVLRSNNGVGLAAPQVGLNMRLILCKDDPDSEKIHIFLNPLITEKEGLEIDVEGCLSIPDLQVDAISIKFASSVDETQNASKIAAKLDANHHIVYVENYLRELPKAISIIKLPFWDLHWYHVVKKSQSISKYLASGDGGDELFGGYTFRYKKFLSLTNVNSTPLEKVKAYLLCHERDHVPDQEKIFGKEAKFSWECIYKTLIPYFSNTLSSIEQVFLADYNGKLLYNFSPLNERISNYFGMKSISPLLSEEMISYSLSISAENKYDKTKDIGKLSLRKLLSKYEMDKFIPAEKLGFNVNTLNLWKSFGKSLCQEYLMDSQAVRDGWINKDWISKHIRKDDLDVRYVNKFLGLLAFEVWYRLFITKDMSANTTLN